MPSYEVVIPSYRLTTDLDAAVRSIRSADPDVPVTVVASGLAGPAARDRYGAGTTLLSLLERVSPARARNLGIKGARADWVCCIDSDCLVKPDYFTALRRILAAAPPDVVAVTGSVQHALDSRWGELEARIEAAPRYNFTSGGLSYSAILKGANLVLRRSFFGDRPVFNETLPSAEDRELGARICRSDKKVLLAEELIVTHRYARPLRRVIKRHLWHARGNAVLYARYPRLFRDSLVRRLRDLFPRRSVRSSVRFGDELVYRFLLGLTYLPTFYFLLFREKLLKTARLS